MTTPQLLDAGSSPMTDCGRQLELASPTLSESSHSSESGVSPLIQSVDQTIPVVELVDNSPEMIEGNDNDNMMLEVDKRPDSPKSRHTVVKDLTDTQGVDRGLSTCELSRATKSGACEHFTDQLIQPDHVSGGSSPELERDCSCTKQDAGEIVSHRSSRESSHPNSHISISSFDSSEVVLCKTPTMFMSPHSRTEEESSSYDLFHTSFDEERVRQITEDERENETEAAAQLKAGTTLVLERVVVHVESSDSRSSSVATTPLPSPPINEKPEDDGSPMTSFSIPDYPPLDEYSFGAYDEDIPYSSAPLELVTPVNERTVTLIPGSVNAVKKKQQDLKTPACGQAELQTDDDITPMPDFKSMRTPSLKGECARFGVKALPKKKMIAKLHEIYEHTHPLVGKLLLITRRLESLSVCLFA